MGKAASIKLAFMASLGVKVKGFGGLGLGLGLRVPACLCWQSPAGQPQGRHAGPTCQRHAVQDPQGPLV